MAPVLDPRHRSRRKTELIAEIASSGYPNRRSGYPNLNPYNFKKPAGESNEMKVAGDALLSR